jgi:DNA-binding MarR family transcriptional regulator
VERVAPALRTGVGMNDGEDVLAIFGATVKALRSRFDGLLREHGVRLGQYQLLRALWERDGMTPRELAEHAAVEMPTVTRTVQRMVRDGFVRREAHPSDARSVRILLAPKGKALETAAVDLRREMVKAALAGISSEDRAQLASTLERVLQNLTG